MKRRRIHRPTVNPLPVAGWKSVGVMPETPTKKADTSPHDLVAIRKFGMKYYPCCRCGWRSSRGWETEEEVKASHNRHWLREREKEQRFG